MVKSRCIDMRVHGSHGCSGGGKGAWGEDRGDAVDAVRVCYLFKRRSHPE